MRFSAMKTVLLQKICWIWRKNDKKSIVSKAKDFFKRNFFLLFCLVEYSEYEKNTLSEA